MQIPFTDVRPALHPLRGSMSLAGTSMKNGVPISIKSLRFLLGWFWGFYNPCCPLSASSQQNYWPYWQNSKNLTYEKLPTVGLLNPGPGSMRHPWPYACLVPAQIGRKQEKQQKREERTGKTDFRVWPWQDLCGLQRDVGGITLSGQEFWITCWENKGRCGEEGVGAGDVMKAHERENRLLQWQFWKAWVKLLRQFSFVGHPHAWVLCR